MSVASVPVFSIQERDGARLTLRSSEGHVAHIFVIDRKIMRVLVLPFGRMREPRTWSIAPGLEDVAPDGRNRFDLEGFDLPKFALEEAQGTITLTTDCLRLSIATAGLFCDWEVKVGDEFEYAAGDRRTQSYNFGWWPDGVYHYLRRLPDEFYFGLGERAGNTNRAGGRFRMRNIDALAYNARTSDPLYKQVPFYITRRKSGNLAFGLFYDTLADCVFDLGCELDAYHGPFRYFAAEAGDLDYYFIAGPEIAEIVRRFTWLTGRPLFAPKWSLGYSGSTMTYTDAPDAQRQMNLFLDKCREHDIPCDSFHLSSGYTTINSKRYVFNWDRNKFPDPEAFARNYLEHGVRLCANIKPCLLADHPQFEDAAAKGLFIRDGNGRPEMVQFWGGMGAYLDFTNPATIDWWKSRIKQSLLDFRIKATWNDNNEFEIWNPDARAHGFGRDYPAAEARPLQTLSMIRASLEAQREHSPDVRPFAVTRSGAPGMQRYAQTWSGDNYTSWETLRFNIKMGIGLSLSGISNIGHDVGGFAGPAPDRELFLRWVQFGIFMPRFSIHSWNDDGTVNEPWMYPELTPAVKRLIDFRYRLLPHLYNLLWRYHTNFDPMIRPTFLDFPTDERCFAENDDMMLGDSVLVAAVVEPGATSRTVHLPAPIGWYDYWSGTYYEGGSDIALTAPLDPRTPLLVREGSALAVNLAPQHFSQPRDERGFEIFPHRGRGRFVCECFEDDGESYGYRAGNLAKWTLEVESDFDEIAVRIDSGKIEGKKPICLLLPDPRRRIRVLSGKIVSDSVQQRHREIRIDLSYPESS